MQRTAALYLRRRGVHSLATAAVLRPLAALRLQSRNEAEKSHTSAADGAKTEMPPGYRVDPDPKGTHFMLYNLPVIYFVAFWGLLISSATYFFLSRGKKAAEHQITDGTSKK